MLAGLQEATILLKRFILPLIVLLIIASIMSHPMRSQAQGLLIVQFQPAELQQGRTALIRVAGTPDLTRVEAVLNGERFPLYRSIDGDWVGFFPAGMNAERGAFNVAFDSWRGDEANPSQTEIMNVVWGGFLYQDIVLPNALTPLLDPALNDWENDTLERVYSRYTPEKLWEGDLMLPVPGPQISEFGGIRNYNNGVLEGRHTGTDYRAGVGEPVSVAGHGRVVYANFLPVHGNHIVVDHGIGVLTGYSHLSEIFVVPGQRVLAGDVIGLVGATGRVQGAHLHFEITVNGYWVDPPQFMTINIPEAAPVRAKDVN
jgi:murein DD-endopeptidase MepM/ murein hydrolase activator NlpD